MMTELSAIRAARTETDTVRLDLEGDEATRVRLASRSSTPASVLQILANDPAITVRAAVAINPAFAPAADRRLQSDSDERVRMLLAGKVARLLPGLSGAEHEAAQTHIQQTLLALADDVAVRVRSALAEAVGTMPEAPRALILKLARDEVAAVSDPVVRLSPLLTDADLLELLATPAHSGLFTAVASRAHLASEVSDCVAAHADHRAIKALLENPSAAIQEATLDALIGRAGDHPEWHEPLVRRPALPERAARALSFIVAGHLLELLVKRADLPDFLAEELRQRLGETLEPPAAPSSEQALDKARQLNGAGSLNEALLLDVAETGDHRLVAAILSVAAEVDFAIVDRAVSLRSGKALISLVWKAGFSMRAAQIVQSMVGHLSPTETLGATADQGFPLTPDEMEWQIELLGEPGR